MGFQDSRRAPGEVGFPAASAVRTAEGKVRRVFDFGPDKQGRWSSGMDREGTAVSPYASGVPRRRERLGEERGRGGVPSLPNDPVGEPGALGVISPGG
jgi:hypothetical protein